MRIKYARGIKLRKAENFHSEVEIHEIMASCISFFYAFVAILLPVVIAQSNFDYSQQPIPIPFYEGDRYPNRPETDVCRPIFDHILRNSARFTSELVFNTNPDITFATMDSRRMTSRMQTRLDRLREIYSGDFTVLKTWTQFPDNEVLDPSSLHYEGEDQSNAFYYLSNNNVDLYILT